MPRFIRNTVVLAKVEATVGVDAAPTGAADAMLISDVSIEVAPNNVDRELIRGFMGASEQLLGTRSVRMSFSVELAGSGTPGIAPRWGRLLRGCGMAEVITAGNRVEYTPVTFNHESLTIHYHLDGARHRALGCRGSAVAGMGIGERPMLRFTFEGVDGGLTAVANPTPSYAGWQIPEVITDPNTGDVILGGTYANGEITGGTAYPSRGLEIDLGNEVRYVPMLGGDSIDIVGRSSGGRCALDLTAAQQAAMYTAITGNVLTSLGMRHGTAAGRRVTVFAPAAQRINPRIEDVEGRALLGMDLRLTPVLGNDELRFVAS